jgi:uncharacterized protein (TIGR03083 family)
VETDPRPWIAVLRRSHDDLAAKAATMSEGDLRRPSGSREWDVSQVLSHLGSGAEIALGGLEAALADGDQPPVEDYHAVWDRWNAIDEPAVRAEAFIASDERHVSAWEALDGSTLASLTVRFPFLPDRVGAATAVGLRLSEHTLHSWDVHVATHPAAPLAGDATALLVDQLPILAGLVGRAHEWHGPPVTLAVVTTDPDRRLWLEVGDRVQLGSQEQLADGALVLPAEALVRLAAGRLGIDHTPAGVTIDGPMSLDDLRAVFPGY